ncbi:MAG: methionyl-tRNA formyltransferase [Microthrixaceae bacterium]
MRLVYLGSPAAAVPPLHALVGAGHEVALVVTNPPRRRGRRSDPSPTPVGLAAEQLGLDVSYQAEDVLDADAELGVVVAYGHIIGPEVLARLRMVNLHFSLLPRWRGAAPVERAILAGDSETGVCVMEVEEGLDTGGVFASTRVPIERGTTAAELRDQLVAEGSEMLVATLAAPLGEPTPQASEGVTYAEKLSSSDLQLQWERSAAELVAMVMVGGAWTTLRGKRLKVLQASAVDADVRDASGAEFHPGELVDEVVICGSGALELEQLQPEGKAPMPALAFLNGARIDPGTRLGT